MLELVWFDGEEGDTTERNNCCLKKIYFIEPLIIIGIF